MADFFIGQSWLLKKKKDADAANGSVLRARGILWLVVFMSGMVVGMTLDGSLRMLDKVVSLKPAPAALPAAAPASTPTSPTHKQQAD